MLAHLHAKSAKSGYDGVSDRSLSPDKSSGESDSGTSGGSWVPGVFDVCDIECFLDIDKICDSRAITGSARETSELNKTYSSEDNQDSYNNYEFNEGESFIYFGSYTQRSSTCFCLFHRGEK